MNYLLSDKTIQWYIKPILFCMCLVPFVMLAIQAVQGSLGVNPVEEMTHRTGEWALRFLLITLSVTPVRRLFGMPWLIKLRRMLGLYTFFYAFLHFLTYIWFDQYFDWMEILIDIPKRPFITVGFLAFILLIPLAITSTNKMIRRLGKKWAQLHQLVYVIAVLGVLHFLWVIKADTFEPLVYASVLLVLFINRVYHQRKNTT